MKCTVCGYTTNSMIVMAEHLKEIHDLDEDRAVRVTQGFKLIERLCKYEDDNNEV